MIPPKTNFRYERKFLAPGWSLEQVCAAVREHPALFREVFPPRTINNLYLDTPGRRDYTDHVNGVSHRSKTRIRWYGALTGPIPSPALERKIRRGAVSGKLSWPLPALWVPADRPFEEINLHAAWEALPPAARASARDRIPSLVNRYRRRYLLSADGRLRLTIDWGLEFFAPRWTAGLTLPCRPAVPAVVLEMKFAPADADLAHEAARAFPLRPSRCSKYVLGVRQTARQ